MGALQTIETLVAEVQQHDLYSKLIHQLNKDLALANIDLTFPDAVSPADLKLHLYETVYQLIQEKFMDYLNLLYIIDVSEASVKKLDGNDVVQLSENVVFLMLKREWQKVYYKSNHRSANQG